MKKIKILTECGECGSKNNLFEAVEREVLCYRCLNEYDFHLCCACGKWAYEIETDDWGKHYYCVLCFQNRKPKKKIVVHFQNGYGFKFQKEFGSAEDYLVWKQNRPDEWNKRNDLYLELIKITTRWLPLDWSDFK